MKNAVGRGIKAALAAIPVIVRDLVGLSGAASIAYGTWVIYRPAGFIVGGMLAVIGAYLAGRRTD